MTPDTRDVVRLREGVPHFMDERNEKEPLIKLKTKNKIEKKTRIKQ